MNAYITVNSPSGEFDLKYKGIDSLDAVVASIKEAYPTATSLVIVVTI